MEYLKQSTRQQATTDADTEKTVATARVAGVENVIVATPAHGTNGIHPAIFYALELSGASMTLAAGGVQGIASLAYGYFSGELAVSSPTTAKRPVESATNMRQSTCKFRPPILTGG